MILGDLSIDIVSNSMEEDNPRVVFNSTEHISCSPNKPAEFCALCLCFLSAPKLSRFSHYRGTYRVFPPTYLVCEFI